MSESTIDIEVDSSELTENQVFKEGIMVVMDSKCYTDWDSFLSDLGQKTADDIVEVLQFQIIAGG